MSILYFSVCPHVSKHELAIFEEILREISEITGKQTKIVQYFSLNELKSGNFAPHIVYANPEHIFYYLDRGYKPLGKLKKEYGAICLITKRLDLLDRERLKIATLDRKYFYFPLLFLGKNYEKFQLSIVNNLEEVYRLVDESQVDLGVVCKSSLLKRYEGDKNHEIHEHFCLPIKHYLLIHPSLEDYIEPIQRIEQIEPIMKEELDLLKILFINIETFLSDWSHHDITEAILSSPNIGVIIYHEKILLTNEYTRKLLGYTEEELLSTDILDLIISEDKAKAAENKSRRLRGEKFYHTYELNLRRKDGSTVLVEAIANTILYRGLNCGFVIFYDITEKKYAEKYRRILTQVNKITATSFTEEELYSEICKTLVDILNFRAVAIRIIDSTRGTVFTKDKCGDLSLIEQETDFQEIKESNLLQGIIQIEKNQHAFRSKARIPLFKLGKVVSLLEIVSDESHIFSQEHIDFLREIQKDISSAIDRLEKTREDTIISEALKNSDTWVLVTDENGRILYVNETVEKISGYSKEELIGKTPSIFKSGLNPPEFYREMWDTIKSGKIFNAITPNRKKNGEIFHADLKIIPLKLPGDITRFVAVARDVTEKIKLSERIQKLQNFDALTGLLNMNSFASSVSRELENKKGTALLILLDIYDMTYLNVIHGIQFGDQILIQFASLIKRTFDNTEIIARIGADTFGVFLVIDKPDQIYKIYSKLFELNNFKITIDDKTATIQINSGISLYPRDGLYFKSLYERADIALQRAKKAGPGIHQFFDPELEKQASKTWEISELIKKAFDNNLFTFFYQPYFYTDTLKLAGFEALVRIIDSDGKMYTPAVFIDYLEGSQYMLDFERFALTEITKRIEKWQKNIAINISGKTFNNPILLTMLSSIPSSVRQLLTIEITERNFIVNPEYATQMLSEIKGMESPPKIAIDDFGTGYSSLIYLKDLPLDVIKIDRSFIKDMLNDRKSLAIVQTIIDLARRLEKTTLAEGVENEMQLQLLKLLGCTYVQGFLLAKPMPEAKIIELFTQGL